MSVYWKKNIADRDVFNSQMSYILDWYFDLTEIIGISFEIAVNELHSYGISLKHIYITRWYINSGKPYLGVCFGKGDALQLFQAIHNSKYWLCQFADTLTFAMDKNNVFGPVLCTEELTALKRESYENFGIILEPIEKKIVFDRNTCLIMSIVNG